MSSNRDCQRPESDRDRVEDDRTNIEPIAQASAGLPEGAPQQQSASSGEASSGLTIEGRIPRPPNATIGGRNYAQVEPRNQIGRSDLDPIASQLLDPNRDPNTGGMFVGPDHPAFGGRFPANPAQIDPGFVPGGSYPPSMRPPSSRFDPVNPFDTSSNEPDPDHLRFQTANTNGRDDNNDLLDLEGSGLGRPSPRGGGLGRGGLGGFGPRGGFGGGGGFGGSGGPFL
ncbi:hypothetical protein EV182_004319, partial [Spiromyces aspiralis]